MKFHNDFISFYKEVDIILNYLNRSSKKPVFIGTFSGSR